MKKTFFITIVIAAVLSCSRGALAVEKLLLATGGKGGVYYHIGLGMADLLNKHVEGIAVSAEAGGDSVSNARRLADGSVSMALMQGDTLFYAYNGQPPFKEPHDNFRVIASLYPELIHCFARKSSNIHQASDLKGKRVSVGEPVGGFDVIPAVIGLKYSEMNTEFFDFGKTAVSLSKGWIDAGFIWAGCPAPAVSAIADAVDVDLVSFDEGLLAKLFAERPYFMKGVIPATAYRGVEHDTTVPAVMAMLVCNSDMPELAVYDITKAIFENLPELLPTHPVAAKISLENALLGVTVHLHPGAARYYAERGMKTVIEK